MINTSGFFETMFQNARENAVIVMDKQGTILRVNPAFTGAFGYMEEDICGRMFNILFTENDRHVQKPELELANVLSQGSGSDDNYLVTKSGHSVWVSGESVICEDGAGVTYIVKVIHNINEHKLLQQLLMESHEFVESIFQAITNAGLLVMDMQMKVRKANATFFSIFGMKEQNIEGAKLSDLPHPFWQDAGVRQRLREMIITGDFFNNKSFELPGEKGTTDIIRICLRPVDGQVGDQGVERRILMVVRDGEISEKP